MRGFSPVKGHLGYEDRLAGGASLGVEVPPPAWAGGGTPGSNGGETAGEVGGSANGGKGRMGQA